MKFHDRIYGLNALTVTGFDIRAVHTRNNRQTNNAHPTSYK